MTRTRRRKCRHCGQLYEPDPRNRRHQRYCSQPACRRASKAASQRRWLASPKGRDYFRGSANRLRVQTWRKAHPGYWRRRCVMDIQASAEPEREPRPPFQRDPGLLRLLGDN